MRDQRGKLNHEMFEALFRKHYESLLYHSLSIVSEEDVARDIVHDAFIYLWNHQKGLDFGYSLKSYLYKIVRNHSLNFLKHRKVEQKYKDDLSIHSDESEFKIDVHQENIERLERNLENLTPRTREVIVKCFAGGLRYKEIAEELGISVNTVKTHIKNGLRNLRAGMDEDFILLLMVLRKKFSKN